MDISVTELFTRATAEKVSDIFITSGAPIMFKKDGEIVPATEGRMMPKDTAVVIEEVFRLSGSQAYDDYLKTGDCDFSFSISGIGRFRINAFKQRNSMAAVIRVVQLTLSDTAQLGIPAAVLDLYKKNKGLILVTGPAGSGKSTTLACIIDAINKKRNCHIITLEDPIEFLHRDNKSLVSQREVSTDTESYMQALRASLRQAPDIILLGEMRDHDTIRTAITAAETGHLVISTLHTVGAANTIDRIVDIFPPEQQQQTRFQLSMSLRMVVSQRLLPNTSGHSIPAFEIMRVNTAIGNLIREAKTHQIDNVIQTSSQEGMIGMDAYILRLLRNGEISAEVALMNASNPEQMKRIIGG